MHKIFKLILIALGLNFIAVSAIGIVGGYPPGNTQIVTATKVGPLTCKYSPSKGRSCEGKYQYEVSGKTYHKTSKQSLNSNWQEGKKFKIIVSQDQPKKHITLRNMSILGIFLILGIVCISTPIVITIVRKLRDKRNQKATQQMLNDIQNHNNFT